MSRDDSSIAWFLNQAGRHALLTAEQEVILSRQVQAWIEIRDVESPTPAQRRVIRLGERARRTMFNANLRLVVSISKRYANHIRSLDLVDLVQEGCVGLDRAIEKFDPARGYKFSTYSYWWIRQSVTRAISQQDRTVRLPINAIECLNKVRHWAPLFLRDHHRMPSPKECAEFCGVSEHVMTGYLMHASGCGSLDAKARTGDNENVNNTLGDLIQGKEIPPMDMLEITGTVDLLDGWLDSLTDLERKVIEMRYGLSGKSTGLSQQSVATAMGCTRQNVQQLEKRSMVKLKRSAMFGVAA